MRLKMTRPDPRLQFQSQAPLHSQLLVKNAAGADVKPLPGRPALAEPEPAVKPAFDPGMYINAYTRLGMLNIMNVADLGCGAGNFVDIMIQRNQKPEMYLGLDANHAQIKLAKALYPGWPFIYGDIASERGRAEYEHYGAFLMLNLLDAIEDDLGFLEALPREKPLVFSLASRPGEGLVRHLPEGRDVYERYSGLLTIKSLGLYKGPAGVWHMCTAVKW